VAAAERRYGADSAEFSAAVDDVVSELVRQGVGNSNEAVALAERAVALKRRLHPSLDIENARVLESLAKLRSIRGEYLLAIPSFETACSILEKTGMQAQWANCGEELAEALIRVSRFADAQTDLNRVLEIRNDAVPSSSNERSRALGLLSMLQRWGGQYDSAQALLDQALALHQPTNRDSVQVSLQLLKGDLLFLRGDLVHAREVYESEAETSFELRQLGCVDCLVVARRLAYLEDLVGNSSRAMSIDEEVRRIGAQYLGPCHDERASILNDLALISHGRGDFGAAKAFYEQSLAEKTRCSAVNGADPVTPLLNLAWVAERIGDLSEAERRYREVVQKWSQRYGPEHPFVAETLDSLAMVALRSGKIGEAQRQWLKVLEMRRRTLGPNHPDVAWTLTNLGETAAGAGDLLTATRYLDQSLEIHRRAGMTGSPDRLARLFLVRGNLEIRLGNLAAARDSFSEAVATDRRIFGDAHPVTAEAQLDLARAELLSGQQDTAFDHAMGAEQVGRAHLRNTISYLPENQALGYAAIRIRGLDLAVSINTANPRSPDVTFDSVIRSRAAVLDELAIRRKIRPEDPQLADLRSAFNHARERLANLSLRSLRDRQPTPDAILQAARREADQAEQALAEKSAAFRHEQQLADAGLAEIRGALPAGAALVSFLRYDQTALPSTNGASAVATKPPTPSYVAFISTSTEQTVAIVPIGAAASLDALVRRWHSAVSREVPTSETEYRTIAASLRRRIWDPVAPHLGSASRLLIVPDGSINLVSFGALPVDGGYLQERYAGIHYLSAERDLLAPGDTLSSKGLLAVGGADFDNQNSEVVAARPSQPSSNNRNLTRSGCDGVQGLHFNALPGTRGEVDDIAGLWNADSDHDSSATVLTGRAASEEAVKSGIAGRRIVHFATHGFVLDGGCQSAPMNTRSVGGLAPAVSASAPKVANASSQSPLLLSGLALAGANRKPSAQREDDDDGILTAEEVASLQLDGVEWAVLSACDTGLGAIRAGEGVFGLRRSFQIAGARTVIMSLWAVEDAATRQWMRALYEARLHQRLDTLQSVHAASLSVLQDRRARGLSTHPFYWAAFVAAGDWR
jgi:CHAT domain-containing protein